MEQSAVPQPQSATRGTPASSRLRIIVAATLAAALSSFGTFVAYAKYAQDNLYTEAETLELVKGVSRAVGERAYHLGKSQKCDRDI